MCWGSALSASVADGANGGTSGNLFPKKVCRGMGVCRQRGLREGGSGIASCVSDLWLTELTAPVVLCAKHSFEGYSGVRMQG